MLKPNKDEVINNENRQLEVWKVAIQTQMHFNDLLIKSRATVVTVALAVIGATAIALRDAKIFFDFLGLQIHIGAVILGLGIFFLICQFAIDYFYYFPLLLGSVKFTKELDESYPNKYGLTQKICKSVSSKRAKFILCLYYLVPIILGVLLFFFIQFRLNNKPNITLNNSKGDKMKIAIDIDGVIANFVEEFLPKLNDLCECEFHQIVSHDFEKNINSIDKELYKKLWSNEVTQGKIFSVLEPIDGSKESLEKLIKNHEIHLITSRPMNTQTTTEAWLKQNKIPYTKLEFAKDFKDKIEKMSLCDIIVEDELEVARMIAFRGIPVILFDYPWNRIDPNIRRIQDWIKATIEVERIASQVSTKSLI